MKNQKKKKKHVLMLLPESLFAAFAPCCQAMQIYLNSKFYSIWHAASSAHDKNTHIESINEKKKKKTTNFCGWCLQKICL